MLTLSHATWKRYLAGTAAGWLLLLVAIYVPVMKETAPLSLPRDVLKEASPASDIRDILRLPEQRWGAAQMNGLRQVAMVTVAHWQRLTIPAAPDEASAAIPWYAANESILIRGLDFYLVENGQVIDEVRTGDGIEPRDHPLLSPHTVYPFTRGVGVIRHLYVRMAIDSTKPLPIYVRDEASFHKSQVYRTIYSAVLLGCIAGMICCSLLLFVKLYDLVYLYYALVQGALVTIGLATTGMLALFFPVMARNYLFVQYGMLELCILALILYHFFLVRFYATEEQVSPSAMRWQNYTITASFVAMVIVPLVPMSVAVPLTMVSIALIVLQYAIIMSFYMQLKHVFFTYSSTAGLVGAIGGTLLALFGLIEPNFVNTSMYLVGAVYSNLMIAYGATVRLRTIELRRQELVQSLTGGEQKNSPRQSILEQNSDFAGLDVTLMFVDIAAFSLLSRHKGPMDLFEDLARRLKSISEIVQEFGGTIDRSLGDGVLCFFTGGKPQGPAHALQAFRAAKKIQNSTVAQAISSQGDKENTIMPVRIGIHSTEVLIGNLGGSARVDFTIIGTGVNFASRLEAACSPFKINLSCETYQRLLQAGSAASAFAQIAIAVKHHDHLIKAYEYDPFQDDPADWLLAQRAYLDQIGFQRNEERHLVRPGSSVELCTDYGVFKVEDFSLNGFRTVGGELLGQRSLLHAKLVVSEPALADELRSNLLHKLMVEVRWSRRSGVDYLHGFKLYGTSFRQAACLRDLLLRHIGKRGDGLQIDDINMLGA